MFKKDLFESEYATVEYRSDENIVYLMWKKFCCIDDYRTPTSFALSLLQRYPESNFIVDARNGFEDDPEDINWGFSYLIPEMAKTTCKFVIFIMEQVNDIEEEMDLWSKEFGKHFSVIRTTSYDKAVETTKSALKYEVIYEINEDLRNEFIDKVLKAAIIPASKAEPQNISYEMCIPVNSLTEIHLHEIWPSENAFAIHQKSSHYNTLSKLKQQYITNTKIHKYIISFT